MHSFGTFPIFSYLIIICSFFLIFTLKKPNPNQTAFPKGWLFLLPTVLQSRLVIDRLTLWTSWKKQNVQTGTCRYLRHMGRRPEQRSRCRRVRLAKHFEEQTYNGTWKVMMSLTCKYVSVCRNQSIFLLNLYTQLFGLIVILAYCINDYAVKISPLKNPLLLMNAMCHQLSLCDLKQKLF